MKPPAPQSSIAATKSRGLQESARPPSDAGLHTVDCGSNSRAIRITIHESPAASGDLRSTLPDLTTPRLGACAGCRGSPPPCAASELGIFRQVDSIQPSPDSPRDRTGLARAF